MPAEWVFLKPFSRLFKNFNRRAFYIYFDEEKINPEYILAAHAKGSKKSLNTLMLIYIEENLEWHDHLI